MCVRVFSKFAHEMCRVFLDKKRLRECINKTQGRISLRGLILARSQMNTPWPQATNYAATQTLPSIRILGTHWSNGCWLESYSLLTALVGFRNDYQKNRCEFTVLSKLVISLFYLDTQIIFSILQCAHKQAPAMIVWHLCVNCNGS